MYLLTYTVYLLMTKQRFISHLGLHGPEVSLQTFLRRPHREAEAEAQQGQGHQEEPSIGRHGSSCRAYRLGLYIAGSP